MDGNEIKKKGIKIAVIVIVATVALCGGYLALVLNWSYSKGERIGYIQKFSEKGWLCKTWEGELQMLPLPGAVPEKFSFSVRDNGAKAKLQAAAGKRISVIYEQHKGIPTSCFGESEYFAVDVKILE